MEQNRKRPGEQGTPTVNRERRTTTVSPSGGSRPRTGNAAGEAERRSRAPRQNAARPSGAQEAPRRTRTTAQTDPRGSASERRARQAQAEARRERDAREQARREREARERAKQEREAREQTRREREAREQVKREREARAAERRAREAQAKKQREREAREQVKCEREAREQEKKTQREQEKQERSEQRARAKKRKQKKPHRVYNMNIGFKIVTMLAVVAVIVVSMKIFFKVKHIQVVLQGVDAPAPIATVDSEGTGSETAAETTAPEETQAQVEAANQGHRYYTAEEIIKASGIQIDDDNLLSLSKETVASSIHTALPYVNQIQIKKQLPGTVVITVSEFEITYGIQDEAGGWWLMSRDGRILQPATEKTVRGHLLITGMPIQVPTPGDWFKPAATEGADMAEIAAKQKVVLEVIPVLEEASFFKELASVDVSTSYNLTLWYGTRYEIWLGTAENLAYKFRFLEAALLDKEVQHRSGTIDLTFSEDNKAHFMDFR